MFNARLAGGHLYGKQLFTWLSLVVSLMASFVLSFFPLDVLDENWDLIESVSEGFLTYFSNKSCLLWLFVQFRKPIECRKPLLVFINTYSKTGGIMKNMVIDDRLLFFGSLFIVFAPRRRRRRH